MKSRRVLLLVFTLMVGTVGLSQTSGALRQKYGPPDHSGRYVVRPGIGMTVRVDGAGVTRDIAISPIESAASSTRRSSKTAPTMKADLAKAILDEVVPVSRRGRYKGTGNAEFGCTSVVHMEYENAIISITNRCDEQGGGTYSVRVHWKK